MKRIDILYLNHHDDGKNTYKRWIQQHDLLDLNYLCTTNFAGGGLLRLAKKANPIFFWADDFLDPRLDGVWKELYEVGGVVYFYREKDNGCYPALTPIALFRTLTDRLWKDVPAEEKPCFVVISDISNVDFIASIESVGAIYIPLPNTVAKATKCILERKGAL